MRMIPVKSSLALSRVSVPCRARHLRDDHTVACVSPEKNSSLTMLARRKLRYSQWAISFSYAGALIFLSLNYDFANAFICQGNLQEIFGRVIYKAFVENLHCVAEDQADWFDWLFVSTINGGYNSLHPLLEQESRKTADV